MYYLLILLFFVQTGVSEYFHKTNIFFGNDETYFGYSLQLQLDQEFGGRIIVGAPRANSGRIKNNGLVYSCPISTKNCSEIVLEPNDLDISNIGLGSAVDAEQNENGFLVTCAPRWTNRQNQSTIGMCFLLKNSIVKNKLEPLDNIPLLDKHIMYLSQFGEVGFSAQLIQNEAKNAQLLLGAPGVYAWTGTPALYDNLDKIFPIVANVTRTDKQIEQYSYFGYSVSSGKFNASDPSQVFYVAGAPRNNELYGSVNIFELVQNEPFTNRYMFRGSQFGEYFGASLAVGNIVGDTLDDLIIGAPTHSTDNLDNVGCIYVFKALKNQDNLKFAQRTRIDGEQGSSKFGSALSYLGDLNNDGYGEIAVGAPYYNDRGAVYIYSGSETGLQLKQKILASEIHSSLRGFGFSLSRGLDVDNNTNNDLAVGSYISGQVVLFNSRPIIQIQTKLKLYPNYQLNINTTELMIHYCLNYKAHKLLPSNNIHIKLYIMNTNEVSFENGQQEWKSTLELKGELTKCGQIIVFVNGKVFNDINLGLDYNISNATLEEKFQPYEEHHSPTTLNIPFTKGCATKICQPNIQLRKYSMTNWIIGSWETFNFSLLLENTGEPSYNTELVIELNPKHLKCSKCPVYCSEKETNIRCSFKTPILNQELRNISFELDATKLNPNDEKIQLKTLINGKTNVFEIPLEIDVKFEILSKSQPEEINNLSGIQTLVHQYNIENVGFTRLQENAKVNIFLPYQIKYKKILLEFVVTGCEKTQTSMEHHLSEKDFFLETTTQIAANTLFLNCSKDQDHQDILCRKLECELTNSNIVNVAMMIDATVLDTVRNGAPIIFSTFLESQDSGFVTMNSHVWTKLLNKQQEANITLYLVLAILSSLLFVAILILVLYKCGFFTKKHLPDEYESVLLSKNHE